MNFIGKLQNFEIKIFSKCKILTQILENITHNSYIVRHISINLSIIGNYMLFRIILGFLMICVVESET